METSAALGFLRIALALSDDVCGSLREKSVLVVTRVDVYTNVAVVGKHKAAVVVEPLRHSVVCYVEGSPRLRIGR